MSDEWRRVNELFHAALERPDGERAAFVAAQAGADAALRDEVQDAPSYLFHGEGRMPIDLRRIKGSPR